MPAKIDLHQAYIGVGANLGRRIAALGYAVTRLSDIAQGGIRCSAVYETAPVGYLSQPPFLNMVVAVRTELTPSGLLQYLLGVESESGRKRGVRFGPRTLDLDVLLYDDASICMRNLQIPHPRMWERAFVLAPLSDLCPDRRVLGGETVENKKRRMTKQGDVRYVGRFW